MYSYEYMYFKCIPKEKFMNILDRYTDYLKKQNIKIYKAYIRGFTGLLRYLDKKNIDFLDITYDISNEYSKNLNENGKMVLKKASDFLIKDGYISRDANNKYNKTCESLDYYLNDFLTSLKVSGKAENTIKKHRQNLDRFFNFCKSKYFTGINKITRDILEEYMFFINTEKSKKTEKKLSISYIVENILTIKIYFRYLVKQDYIIYNPAELLKLPKQEKKISSNYFTTQELKRFFTRLPMNTVSQLRYRVLFEVMYNLGLRAGEALQIKKKNINFETSILHLEKTKTGEPRSVPMSKYISRYLKVYLKTAYEKFYKNEDGYLFYSLSKKSSISRVHADEVLKKTVIEMELDKRISLHVFRKSIGKHLLEKGLDVRYVQKFLGHKCINATQKYTILNLNDLKEALKKYHPRETNQDEYIKKSKYHGE